MTSYICSSDYIAGKNTILTTLDIAEYVHDASKTVKSAWINTGGWQSWNPAFEVEPGKRQPYLHCAIIKEWIKFLFFPESSFTLSRNLVLAQFVSYLRWDDEYLMFVSCGNIQNECPPVQFVFDRRHNTVAIELCDIGKAWKAGELQAQIEVFEAHSFFEAKDKLGELFGRNHFKQIDFLGKKPGGWESWYNHYTDINERLILDDLASLPETDNIISKGDYSSVVFQIDDGWEKALGDWEPSEARFPNGLEPLASRIEESGYIPGLWIAPFLCSIKSETAKKHPDWLLRDKKGKLVKAGFNPLWSGMFYCLDISIPEVLSYLDALMERAVNGWGFRYLKLDFLYAGMYWGAFRNGGALYEHYNKAVKMLTSRTKTADGRDVCYLGCGLPFEQSFRYFPLSRIGCDTREHWENKPYKLLHWNGRNAAFMNLKDTLGHAMWDQTIFANDPDVLFVRTENCSLTRDEKLLIAAVGVMFGSQIMYSDDPAHSDTDEEKALTKEILEIIEKYRGKEFSVKPLGKERYAVASRDGNTNAVIELGKQHRVVWEV